MKPQDLKMAVRLMAESRAGICAAKKLAETPLDLPEVEKQLARLEKAGLVKVNGEFGEAVVVMTKPMAEFTMHVQSYGEQLDLLMPSFISLETQEEKKVERHSKREDMNLVMAHYAKAKGVADEDAQKWIYNEYSKNAKGLVRLLSEAGTVERACEVIDAVKKDLEADGLSWSLNGAVLTRMHGILRKVEKKSGGWDW